MSSTSGNKTKPVAAKKMAAISVIANPLSKNQDKVLLFQSGDTSYGLRVSSRDIAPDAAKDAIGPKDRAAVARPLAQPGQLVSMVLLDNISVFGITGEETDDLQAEILSPVQAPLIPKPVTGALAGCSRPGGEQGWLYMIANDDEGNSNIIEWELSAQAPDQRVLDCQDFSLDTNLYAVYDSKTDICWLIYQKKDKSLVVFDTKHDKGYPVTNSTTRVINKTPLAAAIVPTPTATDPKARRLVLYFIDAEEPKKRYLSSANAPLGQQIVVFDSEQERPKVLELEEGKQNLLDWAGMSAYVDAPRERVILYALTTKTPGQEPMFKAMPHPWKNVSA